MNSRYLPPDKKLWQGRDSASDLYLHEKVLMGDLTGKNLATESEFNLGILGYACDEGVRRNRGRLGAAKGPDAIRRILATMPNHLPDHCNLLDFGNISCPDSDMEAAQEGLANGVSRLKAEGIFPLVLGGGHDMAYGHYKGLKDHVDKKTELGIINFDAHFDLRSNEQGNNSGTPFYQLGQECRKAGKSFKYLCLGIRDDANDRNLYNTASVLGVNYMDRDRFRMDSKGQVIRELEYFLDRLDAVYVSIDLDGFSSAYAPGVSAPSPLGFEPDIVLECLKTIIHSKKIASLDIAEMNPEYDRDQQTAKLAAGLIHFVIHSISLL